MPILHMKRKLGLSRIQFKLEVLETEASIEEYTLCYDSMKDNPRPAKPPGQLESFCSCLLDPSDSHTDAFMTWVKTSTNYLLSGLVDHVNYSDSLMFRPPNAACASSKVILCAESASISLDEADEAIMLQLFDVSQVVKQTPTIKPADLPSLSERLEQERFRLGSDYL